MKHTKPALNFLVIVPTRFCCNINLSSHLAISRNQYLIRIYLGISFESGYLFGYSIDSVKNVPTYIIHDGLIGLKLEE